jgi:hypothetical protein
MHKTKIFLGYLLRKFPVKLLGEMKNMTERTKFLTE